MKRANVMERVNVMDKVDATERESTPWRVGDS